MRYAHLLLAAAILTLPLSGFAQDMSPAPGGSAPAAKALTDADRSEIENIIKDYLTTKHPEVIMQAMQELQKRDQATAEAKSKEAVGSSKDKIYNNPDTPVGGNPKGDVTIVEFFDYQCGYCKMSEESVEKLLKEDKGIKFIYKDFPILGQMSTVAAHAAIASVRQGKYIKFHDALMAKKDHLTEDLIYQTAKEVGLDVEKLKKDMGDDQVNKIVDDNLKLGSDVGVRGTPMFIIGEQVYPGALPIDQMKKAISDARAGVKK